MKVNRIVIVICILMCLMIVVNSHSGRTDANGGHWDHSTGTYHFHSGEYAGRGSSSSSSKEYEYEPFTPPYEPPTDNPYRIESEDSNKSNYKNNTSSEDNFLIKNISAIIIFSPFALYVIISILHFLFESLIENRLPGHKIQMLENKLDELDKKSAELSNFNEAILKARKKQNVPQDSELGEDNLPREKNKKGWGNRYTVYVSRYGRKLHLSRGCCNAFVMKNVYEYKACSNKDLCKLCSEMYKIPDMRWVDELILGKHCEKDYMQKLERYNIAKEEAKKLRADCYIKLSKFILKHSNKNRDKLNTAEIRLEAHLKQQFVNPSQTEKR